MKLGIVGHESAKFTKETEQQARDHINRLLDLYSPSHVVSGGCHLGGIDIWAIEEAKKYGISEENCIEYRPATLRWSGGYKERNIQIARESDRVVCIVVKRLPEGYHGMRFPYCYHCKTDSHVKSGGCWTAWYANDLGKPINIIEI